MMDRVKEGIFSSLGSAVVDATVVDLYAGSGSLGLEALSRGASSCVFVERHRRTLETLRRNVSAVGLGGEVVAVAVEDYLERPVGPFTLAFVDPPYELPLPSVEQVLARLARALAADAIVVVHRRVGDGDPTLPGGLVESDRRRYGQAEITRLVKEVAG